MADKKYQVGEIPKVEAKDFAINPAELYKYFPGKVFETKRVYWIDNPKETKKTSQHCHTDEDEIFIVISGSLTMFLDDGNGKEKVKLQENKIIWVPKLVWHGFEDLSEDCIVLGLSSTNYDPKRKGYVKDYSKFLQLVNK